MHEDQRIHPNSTIVVLSNVSLSTAATTTMINNGVNINVGTDNNVITTNATGHIDGILSSDAVKLNLDSSDSPHTTTQYFFSSATPLVTTSTINQLQSNNNTILIEDTNADIIVCNGDDTLTVSADQQSLRYDILTYFYLTLYGIRIFSILFLARKICVRN